MNGDLSPMFTILTLLQIKHFFCDGPFQTPYQYKNKGTYGHFGGILHAALHAILTGFIISGFSKAHIDICLFLGFADFIVHYHMDWFKVWLCNKMNWKPDNNEHYWHMLMFDQLVHQLTYIAITWYLFSVSLI